ncbi:MAG: Ig-like domain-containing protein [Cellvibrionaceae bacterium]|nr:Ig-like domain-containing protein [Cellvibrionaceae bacterium]
MAKITNISDNYGSIKGQVAQGGVTDDKSLQLRGTAKAGQKVNIYKDGEFIGTTKANKAGIWKFKANGLDEGDASFTVAHVNGKGKESGHSQSFDVTIDRSVDVTDKVSLSNDSQTLVSGQSTSDGEITMRGRAEAGAEVEILDGDKVIATVTANDKGEWSAELKLDEGNHELCTKVTDQAGNTSAIESIAKLDVLASQNTQSGGNTSSNANPPNTAPPVILPPDAKIVDDGFRNDNTPLIRGTATPGSSVTMTVQGTTYGPVTTDASGVWEIQVTVPLPEGESLFAAKATNSAGDAFIGYRIVIDTEAPDSPVIVYGEDNVGTLQDDLDHQDHTDDDTPGLNGTGEIGSTITIYKEGQFFGFTRVIDDGNGNGVWSFTPTAALLEGEHSFSAYSIDAAGNISSKSNNFEITVDRSVDAPKITHLVDNVGKDKGKVKHQDTTDDTKPEIVGTAEAHATVTVWVNGKNIGNTTADKDGNWSFTVGNNLKEGMHKVEASQTDLAGNSSDKSEKFKFEIVLNSPPEAKDDNYKVQGETTLNVLKNDKDSDGDPLTITKIVQGPSHGTVSITKDGKLLYTPDNSLNSIVNDEIKYKTSDGRGGTSTATVSLEVTPELPTPTIDLKSSSDSGWYDWDNVTNDTTPTLQGTARANSTISLYQNGSKIADVNVDSNGEWEYDVPYIYHGNYDFHVTSEAFGLSRDSSNLSLTIDTQINAYLNQAGAGMEWQTQALHFSLLATTSEAVRYTLTGSDTVTGTLFSSGATAGYSFAANHAWGTFGYIYASFEDVAGNISNSSTAVRYGTAPPPPPPRHWDPIAALEDGGYVVSFAQLSDIEGNGFDIYAQRYNAAGEKVGEAFLVNQEQVGNQSHSDAVGLDDGGFVLTWQSEDQDGDKLGVYARRYDADGQAMGDEILINEFTQSNQSLAEITALEGAGFAVTWMSEEQDGSGLGVFLRIYDSNGEAISSDIQVADNAFSHQVMPSITTLSNGNIVLSWQDHQLGEAGIIRASIYSATGELLQSNFDISSSAAAQQWPFISALDDGGFAVSWHENNEHGESAVMIQSFDENGTALNDEAFFVANATAGEQAEIAGLDNGNILVSWVSEDEDNTGVYYSIVSPKGELVVEQTLVNQNQAGQQVESHTLSLKDGGYLITWVEVNEEGELLGVHGQQFNPDGSLTGNNFVVTGADDKGVTSENNLIAELNDETIPSFVESFSDTDPIELDDFAEDLALTVQDSSLLFSDLLSTEVTNLELTSGSNSLDSIWNDDSMGSYIDLGNLQLSLAEMNLLQEGHDVNHII